MTAALVIALAVVAVVAASLTVVTRRAGRRAVGAEERIEQLTARLGEAVEVLEEVHSQKRAAEVRATAAEGRARTAEQKATDAERRSGDAEKRVAEANRRAGEAVKAGAEARSAAALWALERLRVLREWADVVGPGVGLPVPWEKGIAAVVAAELSVIRETMGTPSELELLTDRPSLDPARSAVAGRAGVEILRRLARSGDEMAVALDRQELTITQPLAPDEQRPDLTDLVEACTAGGLDLTVEESEGSWKLVLAFSRPN